MVPTTAYHYVVTREGRMFEGREILNKGSHVHLQNTRKICIVCVGDYHANWRNVFAAQPGVDVDLPIRVFGGHKEFGAPVFEKL